MVHLVQLEDYEPYSDLGDFFSLRLRKEDKAFLSDNTQPGGGHPYRRSESTNGLLICYSGIKDIDFDMGMMGAGKIVSGESVSEKLSGIVHQKTMNINVVFASSIKKPQLLSGYRPIVAAISPLTIYFSVIPISLIRIHKKHSRGDSDS